jgi:hypothetical protein
MFCFRLIGLTPQKWVVLQLIIVTLATKTNKSLDYWNLVNIIFSKMQKLDKIIVSFRKDVVLMFN